MNLRPCAYLCLTLVLLSAGAGCNRTPGSETPQASVAEAKTSKLVLTQIHPASTNARQPFNVQTDNQSALAVTCQNATNTTRIVFAGKELKTVYGSPTLLTTTVLPELFASPGKYPVKLRNEAGESNSIDFVVR